TVSQAGHAPPAREPMRPAAAHAGYAGLTNGSRRARSATVRPVVSAFHPKLTLGGLGVYPLKQACWREPRYEAALQPNLAPRGVTFQCLCLANGVIIVACFYPVSQRDFA